MVSRVESVSFLSLEPVSGIFWMGEFEVKILFPFRCHRKSQKAKKNRLPQREAF